MLKQAKWLQITATSINWLNLKGELMQTSFDKEILFWTPKWKFYYFVWSYAKTRHKIYVKLTENILQLILPNESLNQMYPVSKYKISIAHRLVLLIFFSFVFNHKITISFTFKNTTEAAFTKIKIFPLFFFSCLGHN